MVRYEEIPFINHTVRGDLHQFLCVQKVFMQHCPIFHYMYEWFTRAMVEMSLHSSGPKNEGYWLKTIVRETVRENPITSVSRYEGPKVLDFGGRPLPLRRSPACQ
jgi:hypothetical protein